MTTGNEPACSGSGDMPAQARFHDLMADLPVLESETAQIGRGVADFRARQVCGRDIVLTYLELGPILAGHVVPDPEWLSLMVPLRWQGDYRFNGLIARPYDVFISAGANGYATAGEGRHTLNVGIRKSRLQQTMRQLFGGATQPLELFDQRLSLGPGSGIHLQKTLVAAIDCALELPGDALRYALEEAIESDLFAYLARMLLAVTNHQYEHRVCRVDALRIVSAAKLALDESDSCTASLADLCAASGVGQTWLHKCFVDMYGISPSSYLRSHRLTAARDRLLEPKNSARSVKEVALSYGFMNFGRFAADYRARFGENPSDTFIANRRGTKCARTSERRRAQSTTSTV